MESNVIPSSRQPQKHTTLVVTALSLAIFLVSLDTVVITTALPTITLQFHLSNSEYAWIGSAYLLTNAASIPFWGRVSDVFGRKPVLMLANVFFLVGSIISALSANGRTLIAGRAVQGFGGGGMGALVNIIIGDLFDMRTRSLIYGVIGATWAVSCSMGPLIGAGFTQNIKWPWIFWINLPIDAISMSLIALLVSVPNTHIPFWTGTKSIDWLGTSSITVATILLLIGLQLGGSTYPWGSAIVLCLLIVGVSMYALFVYIQLFVSPSPIMPLRILSHKSIICALSVTFYDAFVFNSVSFFIPLYYQSIVVMSPLRSGVLMLPMALPLSMISILSGWMMERSGRVVELLRSGLFLMTIATGLLISLPIYLDLAKVIPFLILLGTAFGPNFQAPLLAIQVKLRSGDMAAGTATFGFVRMLGGAIGIVVCQVVYQINHTSVSLDNDWRGIISSADGMTAIRHVWILLCVASFIAFLFSFGIERRPLTNRPSSLVELREMDQNNISGPRE